MLHSKVIWFTSQGHSRSLGGSLPQWYRTKQTSFPSSEHRDRAKAFLLVCLNSQGELRPSFKKMLFPEERRVSILLPAGNSFFNISKYHYFLNPSPPPPPPKKKEEDLRLPDRPQFLPLDRKQTFLKGGLRSRTQENGKRNPY